MTNALRVSTIPSHATLAAAMRTGPLILGVALGLAQLVALAEVPDGFLPIFNGRNLAGWHASLTNHHGDTREWRVYEQAVVGKQDRAGNGGILLSDASYGDFEVYMEIKPDFGCDGGVFLRSSASGQAYQVMLDYLEGGNVGGIHGERLKGLATQPSDGWEEVWETDGWNALRVRIRGEAPRIEVWLNETLITDFEDSENRLPAGATEGSIALQVHGGDRCKPGLEHRFRNIAVRQL